ncbi:hypothetical protein HK099_008580 [Clydaea vesicula]|uniref:Vacuolar protein sorting-associated protein 33A n=1 Tax=Clydaea vesicula TaxID=447962 RepID=A0AAD5U4R8_9FUNG|nr:hypothetical protein HK099_008580 [Clydaea vesicula]
MSISSFALKEFAKKQFIQVLDSVRGRKGLVLDKQLSGPLSLIAEFSLLKEHGVEKIYHLQKSKLETECKSLIYIVRPKIQSMKWISEQIKYFVSLGLKLDYHLFFVPRRTLVCEMVLEAAGVFGSITFGEYHLDLIPLDEDVLSLEYDSAFKEIALNGDTTAIYYLAKAIMNLQTIFGLIPKFCGKGNNANILSSTLLKMREELVSDLDDPAIQSKIFPPTSDFESMIIIDRQVDLVTPMCTQLTYEGLIDEVFGIKSTFVELDQSLIGTQQQPPGTSLATSSTNVSNKPKKVPLNSTDKLHFQLRDKNFAVVSGLLNQIAKRISDDYEGRHQAKTIGQIKDFIGRLGGLQAEHQSLRMHVNVCEQISKYTSEQEFHKNLEMQQSAVSGLANQNHLDYIEEMIGKQRPIQQILRLLCLYSLVNDGLKVKHFDFMKKEIVQTYGYEQILTLQNLQKVGLLKKQVATSSLALAKSNNFPSIRKSLRLIVDDVNEHTPNDISYVYSGFAPISIRLVQLATHKLVDETKKLDANNNNNVIGWKNWEDALKLLNGVTFEETQKTFEDFLLPHKSRREFVVVTTNILNGTTLMTELMHNEDS